MCLSFLEERRGFSEALRTLGDWGPCRGPHVHGYGTRTFSLRSSALAIICAARSFRRRFGDFFWSLCCFQAPARLSFPDAVFFKRLAAARFVFILGMSRSPGGSAVRARREN